MTKVPNAFERAVPALCGDDHAPSSEFGEIRIVENRINGSHMYWQEGWQQSEADRNGVSLAIYVHAIFGLRTQTTAREMLMIGCGDGTLATMLTHAGEDGGPDAQRGQTFFHRKSACIELERGGTQMARVEEGTDTDTPATTFYIAARNAMRSGAINATAVNAPIKIFSMVTERSAMGPRRSLRKD